MPYPVENGGSAFPTGMITEGGNVGGMSLRDYFAAQALQGFVVAHTIAKGPNWSAAEIADSCFSIADAMLQERVKQPATK